MMIIVNRPDLLSLTLINPQPRHVFRTLHWLSTMTNSEEKPLPAVGATWIDEADYPAAY